jgi:hypothetical protein
MPNFKVYTMWLTAIILFSLSLSLLCQPNAGMLDMQFLMKSWFGHFGEGLSLLYYYVTGIIVGVAFLLFLPVNEAPHPNLTSNKTRPQNSNIASLSKIAVKESIEDTLDRDADDVSKEDLERIRKQFRLTPQQMDRVLELSKQQGHSGRDTSRASPHQIMNRFIYICMLSFLIYVVNRDYGNIATVWFIRVFPREARTLGLMPSW